MKRFIRNIELQRIEEEKQKQRRQHEEEKKKQEQEHERLLLDQAINTPDKPKTPFPFSLPALPLPLSSLLPSFPEFNQYDPSLSQLKNETWKQLFLEQSPYYVISGLTFFSQFSFLSGISLWIVDLLLTQLYNYQIQRQNPFQLYLMASMPIPQMHISAEHAIHIKEISKNNTNMLQKIQHRIVSMLFERDLQIRVDPTYTGETISGWENLHETIKWAHTDDAKQYMNRWFNFSPSHYDSGLFSHTQQERAAHVASIEKWTHWGLLIGTSSIIALLATILFTNPQTNSSFTIFPFFPLSFLSSLSSWMLFIFFYLVRVVLFSLLIPCQHPREWLSDFNFSFLVQSLQTMGTKHDQTKTLFDLFQKTWNL